MDVKISCNNCGQNILVDDAQTGQTFACPNCQHSLTLSAAPPIPRQPTAMARQVSTSEVQTNVKQGAAIGGWICFGLGVIFMFIPLPTWFIYGPLLLVSVILSIIAIAQRRIGSGIALLLANLLGAPILFVIALTFGLATWSGAISQSLQRAQQRAASQTTSPGTAPTTIEKIEGAFGLKLGDAFDPATAIGTSKLTDGTPLYEFSTTNGFRSFQNYYVIVTPVTQKIYGIWGRGPVESTAAGQREQVVIMELLKQKYGVTEKPQAFDSVANIKRIQQGRRTIITKLDGITSITLEIRYYDEDLKQVAEQERLAAEVKKSDKSGL